MIHLYIDDENESSMENGEVFSIYISEINVDDENI